MAGDIILARVAALSNVHKFVECSLEPEYTTLPETLWFGTLDEGVRGLRSFG